MRKCIIVFLMMFCSATGVVFGDSGKPASGKLLHDEPANDSAARPAKVLGFGNYSTAVTNLKKALAVKRSQIEAESDGEGGKKPAFAAFSSAFGNALTATLRIRTLRNARASIDDYRRIAHEVKERVKQQGEKASAEDKEDSRFIDLNNDEVCAITALNKKELIAAERYLRSVGKQIEKYNRSNKGKVDKNEKLEPAEYARYNRGVEAIGSIEQTIAYNSIDDILQSFDDYDDLFFKFDLGYEFTTVNTTFSRGNPRVDFLLYHRYRHYTKADKEYGGMFDFHTSLAARLTGSEEVNTDTTNFTGTSGTAPKLGDKKSLDYDINIFTPVCKTPTIRLDGRDRLYSMIGPLFVYGGKKVDDKNQVDQRLYGGLRFGISPEMYTDVIYGKTGSRPSRRLEVRGQMPIYRKDNGSQVLLGAIANIGVTDRDTDKGDTVTIYAVWNIDVKDFFGIFK
jgi:hypothetical protein